MARWDYSNDQSHRRLSTGSLRLCCRPHFDPSRDDDFTNPAGRSNYALIHSLRAERPKSLKRPGESVTQPQQFEMRPMWAAVDYVHQPARIARLSARKVGADIERQPLFRRPWRRIAASLSRNVRIYFAD
jgi:hypothetical protein